MIAPEESLVWRVAQGISESLLLLEGEEAERCALLLLNQQLADAGSIAADLDILGKIENLHEWRVIRRVRLGGGTPPL